MLINPERNYLIKSFNKFHAPKPEELRNQRIIIENKTHCTTNDTKNNANSNNNSSYQKTFSLFNESNCDSNSQTDRSSNNIKEIKLTISSKQVKNIKSQNLSNNENNIRDMQSMGIKNMSNISENNIIKIKCIQKWWKKLYKIIFIQKYIRSFLLRRNMINIIYFIKIIFKIIFKLMMDKIKHNIKVQNKDEIISNLYNTEVKNINNKIKKFGTNNKFSKNMKLNYHPSFNATSKINIKKKSFELNDENKKVKIDPLKKIGNNNPINVNLSNNQYTTVNSNKNFDKNKNKKVNKNKKEYINNVFNKDKLIANNIFNIYNNVKKYYENKNNININNNITDSNYLTTNNFIKNNQKKSSFSSKNNNINNNKNMKYKKMESRGSMKNINGKIVINKNKNNNSNNINASSNPKTDRIIRESKNSNNKEINSILYLLKLKKAFLFWKSYTNKKKIIQKLKIIKNLKTPANINKSLSIYSSIKNEEEKTTSIKTKKINLSNSLIDLKLNIITPQKMNMNSNAKPNSVFNNYTKKINSKHSNSVENNNSIINFNTPKSALDCSYNIDKINNLKGHKKNKFSKNTFNNSVLVVSQYDRNHDIKKKVNEKDGNNINYNNMNMTKKIYCFYAIINLIDKHNKRKIIKKWFLAWKSLIRFSRSFINAKGIEEKIINFKNIKSPLKNTINENKFNKNKNNSLFQNNSSSNFSCQTESNIKNKFGHDKANTNINQYDLLTPNPLEKSAHPIFFKSNIKSNQIVYQKKLLVNKKMRNQSMNSNTLNELADDINMTIIKNNNNQEGKYFYQTIADNFFNYNSFINNNNSKYIIRRNNFENSAGKCQNARINRTNGIEETEIFFTPNQNNNMKNSFIVGQKNVNEKDGFNSNTINVNVIENYRNIDLKQDGKENNKNTNNKGKGVITTKQINLKYNNNKRFKNNSHSQECINNNQSF